MCVCSWCVQMMWPIKVTSLSIRSLRAETVFKGWFCPFCASFFIAWVCPLLAVLEQKSTHNHKGSSVSVCEGRLPKPTLYKPGFALTPLVQMVNDGAKKGGHWCSHEGQCVWLWMFAHVCVYVRVLISVWAEGTWGEMRSLRGSLPPHTESLKLLSAFS